ncbi:MAG TPA: hypothetical protein VEQ60_01135 [Longimicrobium sp.]|nr:hypothetical protein [Longimicrobium sp.]
MSVAKNSPVPVRASGIAQPLENPAIPAPDVVTALSSARQPRVPDAELELRFRALAERWREETQFHSSITALFMHPAYQEIIGLGPDALSLILEDLAATRSDWFWALRAISGENPVPASERGQIGKMTERWLEWGHAHGYL